MFMNRVRHYSVCAVVVPGTLVGSSNIAPRVRRKSNQTG